MRQHCFFFSSLPFVHALFYIIINKKIRNGRPFFLVLDLGCETRRKILVLKVESV